MHMNNLDREVESMIDVPCGVRVEFHSEGFGEVDRGRGWPSEVVAQQIGQQRTDRAVIASGHFMVAGVQIDGDETIYAPMIATDIPVYASILPDGGITATYITPSFSSGGQWGMCEIERTYSAIDVKNKRISAVLARCVALKDEGVERFRKAIENDPNFQAYPLYTFMQAMGVLHQIKRVVSNISLMVIVNDWQRLQSGAPDNSGCTPRQRFWQSLRSEDLISYQEILRSSGCSHLELTLISEQKMRARMQGKFKRMALRQGVDHAQGEAYKFLDAVTGKEFALTTCGLGGCATEIVDFMRIATATNGAVLIVNFVPWVCQWTVEEGTMLGLRFAQLWASGGDFPTRVRVVNYTSHGLPLERAIAQLNASLGSDYERYVVISTI